MSQKQWKRARHYVKPIRREAETAKRQTMKIPLRVRFLSLFNPSVKICWIHNWEKYNRDELKYATKKVSHEIVKGGKKK